MSKNNDLTEALAMDCEMVGAGHRGSIHMAARVSLVNENGACVYDVYVKPTKPVTNYRTPVSGVTAQHLAAGRDFDLVKADVARTIKGRILVGHAVDKDLRVLGLCHPEWNIRDTAHYPPFQTAKGTPSLKYLASRYLGWNIQNGSHSSVEDAKAAMMVYKRVEDQWELRSGSGTPARASRSPSSLNITTTTTAAVAMTIIITSDVFFQKFTRSCATLYLSTSPSPLY